MENNFDFLETLSEEELVHIDGGYSSYEFGRDLGTATKNVLMIAGAMALFGLM